MAYVDTEIIQIDINTFRQLLNQNSNFAKELAELTGMSSETVIRVLKKFHTDGLIRSSGKTIEVLDYIRCRRRSEY